jgi:serine/threonine protein kinase
MIVFSCAGCGAALDAPDDSAGQSYACPQCARAMTVPYLPRIKASLPVTPLPPLPRRESPLTDVPMPTDSDDASTLAAERHLSPGAHGGQVFPFLGPAQAPDEIGRLDTYRVLRLLGQGGMGMVFEGEDTVLQRKVALKVMRPDLAKIDAARHRFLREARAAAALHHEHIVTIYQVSQNRDVPYLAMEFLSGESLEMLLRRVGRLPVADALRIGREIAEGLAAAHDRGLIHRDIKPANIWLKTTSDSSPSVRPRDALGRVRIIDFGLVRVDENAINLTGSGAVLGTPAYMAPEQADGETVDARSDLFSLGCVLYRMLTGEVPFKGKGMLATLIAVDNSHIVPPDQRLADIPPAVSAFVVQLLDRNRDKRPSSARLVAEMLRALEALERSTDVSSLSGVAPQAGQRPGLRKGWLVAAGVLVSLLLWGAITAYVLQGRAGKGSLEIKSEEPTARVVVERNGEIIAVLDPQGQDRIELNAGEYAVRLEEARPGVHLDSARLVVLKGANRIVRVRRIDRPFVVRILPIQPPERDFYSKKADYQGIPIKAHAVVADGALIAAHERLSMMLEHCPRVLENLVTSGAELHIIGKDQQTSDLPENRHLKDKPFDGNLTVDQRTRGLGGLAASCGEENLLKLPGDRYAGRDICVHEFAHTIRSYGLSPLVRRRIERQYKESLAKGLWKDSYAAKNDDEFFAELSMWYFGTEGETSKMSPKPERGREGLRRYDPEAFALLDDIYTGVAIVERNVFIDVPLLPPEREKDLKSQISEVPTSILFVNNTPRELEIYWLDFQGQRKLYHRLGPQSTVHQPTFASHPWVVVDGGRARGVVMAVPEPARVTIKDEEKR